MPTTPIGTRTWRIWRPLASVEPRTTSPTGSGSAAMSRSAWATAATRGASRRRRSWRLSGIPPSRPRGEVALVGVDDRRRWRRRGRRRGCAGRRPSRRVRAARAGGRRCGRPRRARAPARRRRGRCRWCGQPCVKGMPRRACGRVAARRVRPAAAWAARHRRRRSGGTLGLRRSPRARPGCSLVVRRPGCSPWRRTQVAQRAVHPRRRRREGTSGAERVRRRRPARPGPAPRPGGRMSR